MPYYNIELHDLKTNQIVRSGGGIKQDWTCIPMLFHDLGAMIRLIPAKLMAKLPPADKAVLGMTRDFSALEQSKIVTELFRLNKHSFAS